MTALRDFINHINHVNWNDSTDLSPLSSSIDNEKKDGKITGINKTYFKYMLSF